MTRVSALVTAVLALLLGSSLTAAPASAAPASLTTTYSCSSSYGGGSSAVTIAVDLPKKVKRGKTIAARTVTASITVPDALVATMRSYGVTAIEGSSSDTTYRVKNKALPISNLVLPRTAVPASGPMILTGSGEASAYQVKRTMKAKKLPVRVPTAFTAQATAYGVPIVGQANVTISCTLDAGAADTIGVVKVRR